MAESKMTQNGTQIGDSYRSPNCPRCGIILVDDLALQSHALKCNVIKSEEHDGTSKCVYTNNLKYAIHTSSGHLMQPSVASYSSVGTTVCKKDEKHRHVCVLCGKEFKTWEDVNKHLQSHNVHKAQHKCSKCGENFHNKHDLDVHVKTHEIGKSSVLLGIQNSNVGHIADIVSKPPAHIVVRIKKLRVTNTKKHKCSMCNEQFQEFSDLNKHLASHVPKVVTTTLTSDISRATFSHPTTLKDHMGTHCDYKVLKFPCVICGQVFCSVDERKQHLVAHIESGEQLDTLLKYTSEKSPTCPFCDKRFAERTVLKAHMLNHVQIRKKQYGCTICGKSFISTSALKEHHCTKPGEKQVSLCYVCQKAVTEGIYLTEQVLPHIDRSNCSICKNEYKIVSPSMKVHRKILTASLPKRVSHGIPTNITKAVPVSKPTSIPKIVPAQKPNQGTCKECAICAKLFTSAAQLVHHIKAYHLHNGLPFCPHCKEYFKNTAALKAHQVVVDHQEKKKICHPKGPVSRCSICNKVHKKLANLKSHSGVHISAGRPFCHLCREYFTCVSDLKEHYQTTHKDRNRDKTWYRCAHCREKFYELSVFRSHMLAHNTHDCLSCDTCVHGFLGVEDLERHLVIHHSNSHSDITSTDCNEPMVQSGQ